MNGFRVFGPRDCGWAYIPLSGMAGPLENRLRRSFDLVVVNVAPARSLDEDLPKDQILVGPWDPKETRKRLGDPWMVLEGGRRVEEIERAINDGQHRYAAIVADYKRATRAWAEPISESRPIPTTRLRLRSIDNVLHFSGHGIVKVISWLAVLAITEALAFSQAHSFFLTLDIGSFWSLVGGMTCSIIWTGAMLMAVSYGGGRLSKIKERTKAKGRFADRNVVRFQFEINPELWAEMERIQEIASLHTKRELLNNALTLLKWAARHKEHGDSIIAMTPDGRQQELQMPCLEDIALHRGHSLRVIVTDGLNDCNGSLTDASGDETGQPDGVVAAVR